MAEVMELDGRHPPREVDLSESWSYIPDTDSQGHRGRLSESYHVQGPTPMQTVEEEDHFPVSYYDRSMDDRFTRSLDLAHSSFFVVDHTQQTDYESTARADSWSPEVLLNDNEEDGVLPLETDVNKVQGQQGKIVQNGVVQQQGTRKKSTSTEPPQTESKIKNTLMSAWNNMRHGWTVKLKTTFKYDDPIFLLGKLYHSTEREREELQQQFVSAGKVQQNSMELFKRDFSSRIWFTYRRDFPAIQGTQLTTDVGWGCMLRSGQMMLAQALVMHLLGRDWRWHNSQKQRDVIFHRQILRYFGDSHIESCPFSIHNLVKIGADMGKKPGDWYGPASVAYVLRDAVEQAPQYDPILGQMCLYVAQDCTVYKQDVIDLCTGTSPYSVPAGPINAHQSTSSESSMPRTPEEHWRACVLLIPVRLGGEALNTIYSPCVQSVLAHDLCLGIIGGKPKHSLYFIGWQGEKLVHLDPHCSQDVVNILARDFPVESFHCMSPRKMSLSKMDPSCTIGFYCRTRDDFTKFVADVSGMVSPPKEKGLYPMFVFSSGRSCDISYGNEEREDRFLRISHFNKMGQLKQSSKDSDDFVLL